MSNELPAELRWLARDTAATLSRADRPAEALALFVDAFHRALDTPLKDRVSLTAFRLVCGKRRPQYDELSGALLPGHEAPDLPAAFVICTAPADHDGDHRDCLKRTWPQQGGAL
ncbi:hypothetical protein [Streptomyces sp. NPDC049881]|uniref:hypothetical protein n=1 Tax=Streptomyces sp. NPDC049881 TaxID=3155778 RepID=UPI00341B4871